MRVEKKAVLKLSASMSFLTSRTNWLSIGGYPNDMANQASPVRLPYSRVKGSPPRVKQRIGSCPLPFWTCSPTFLRISGVRRDQDCLRSCPGKPNLFSKFPRRWYVKSLGSRSCGKGASAAVAYLPHELFSVVYFVGPPQFPQMNYSLVSLISV
ncbi:hypothetical protein DL98DRAFT_514829 [Cadophora sp. DSE1049]|nr:hypothetical protein DL98DRAFT_514829 [Cadophora sp. DSE1049]